MVQWLKLCAPNAEGPGSFPEFPRFCLPQLRVRMLQLKIPQATTRVKSPDAETKTGHNLRNK